MTHPARRRLSVAVRGPPRRAARRGKTKGHPEGQNEGPPRGAKRRATPRGKTKGHPEGQNEGPPRGAAQVKNGGDLLSQGREAQVPSALRGLTALFGMGRGVAPSLSPPKSGETGASRTLAPTLAEA